MFVRNLLQPGDYVTLLPVGIPAILQYSESGGLEKIYWGNAFESSHYLGDAFLDAFRNDTRMHKYCRIGLKGGTSWVYGVFYTGTPLIKSSGKLPDCAESELVEAFMADTSKFIFYASHVKSQAAEFLGAVNIRRWLSMSKFDVIPGFIVPAQINPQSFEYCVKSCGYALGYPKVVSYVIFRGNELLTVNTDLSIAIVSQVRGYLDEYGHLKCKLKFQSPASLDSMFADYADVVHMNITANSMVFVANDTIISAHSTDNKERYMRKDSVTCECCGINIKLPESGPATCTNPQCMSTKYHQVRELLSAFGLPLISFENYLKLAEDHIILNILDILDIPTYADAPLEISISGLISAVIPKSDVSSAIISQFVTNCNNTLQTVKFYISHPDRIALNLSLRSADASRLMRWLSSADNRTLLLEVLDYPRIKFSGVGAKFIGTPMFRNKVIMITGKFTHGDIGEIIAILQSYSATVVTKFDGTVQCIVVGDIPEDVDGGAIRNARNHSVAVYSESEFFARFQIDDDLAQNLH